MEKRSQDRRSEGRCISFHNFQLHPGNLLWHYTFGPASQYVNTIQQNGRYLLAQGGSTVHNGATGNGWNGDGTPTSDGNMYASLIDKHGNEVFTTAFVSDGEPDGNNYCHFVDLNSDGDSEYLVFEGHFRNTYRGTSQIHQLDMETGDVLNTFNGPEDHHWAGRIFGDLDGDGDTEILATAAQSSGYDAGYYDFTQYLLDENLEVIGSSSLTGVMKASGDIDADGIAEIFIMDDDVLRVTDLDFNEIWTWAANGAIRDVILSDIDSDGILDI